MSGSGAEPASDHQTRLERALAEYLHAVELGQPLDRAALIAAHPDLADDLQSFFRNRDAIERAAAQLKNAAEAPTITGLSEVNADSPGPTVRYFGDYELLEEIARGGMGVVYKARQVNLNRTVALKMILAGQLANDADVKRFYAEAEAAAKLDHPGIVPIFEIGQHEGQHYFSMAFVEGASLAKKVANGPLPAREAAQLVQKVAEAVQYAHEHDIIHRDLKPANVLLDGQGQCKVTDFGLAKQMKADSGLTGTGQILGTPSYMPPEQAAGKIDEIGPAADVYSLGAILYCLVTGRPPFQAANPMDTLLQVLNQEPVPPRQLNPQVPLDLETIALKCLEKDQSRRYATARGVSEELLRYLEGRPIVARPVGSAERAIRWCRRNRAVAALTGAVALSLLAGTIISASFAVQSANRADEKGKLADANAKLAEDKGKLADNNARLAVSEREAKNSAQELADRNGKLAHEEARARAAAEQQLRIATAERLAAVSYTKRAESPEAGLLLAVESGRATHDGGEGILASSHQALLDALGAIGGRPLIGHRRGVNCAAISPDNHFLVTGSNDGTARIWDLTAKDPGANPRVLNGPQSEITALAISADSRWAVTAGGDYTARIWDLAAENPNLHPRVLSGHVQDSVAAVMRVAISADCRWVATACHMDKTARIWDLTSDDPSASPRVLKGHQDGITSLAISADSHWVVTGSRDKTARIWDLTDDSATAKPRVLRGHDNFFGAIGSVAISPDCHWVVTGSYDQTARIWDLTAEQPSSNPRVLTGHQSFVTSVAISADSRWVVTGGSGDMTARVWDLTAEKPSAGARVLSGHQGQVDHVAISPDSRWVITGCHDKTPRIWDLTAKDPSLNPRILTAHQSSILCLAVSSDSRWLVTGSGDSTARIWDLTARTFAANPCILSGFQSFVSSDEVSADSHWLVTIGGDGAPRIWDLKAENPNASPRILKGYQESITSAAISADNRWVATASRLNNAVRIWDLKAEKPSAVPRNLSGHGGVVESLAISANSRWLVTGSNDSTARIWDLTADDPAAKPRVLRGHQGGVSKVAISPDNRWVVTGSGERYQDGNRIGDDKARIWDLTDENPSAAPRVLSGHLGKISSLAISPDSRWVVTGSSDGTARICDLTAADPNATARVLSGHGGDVLCLAISADSRWVISGSSDARVWDLTAENPSASSRALSGHESWVNSVAISPDSRWAVTGSPDKTARIWDLTADDPNANPHVLTGHEGHAGRVAISPDGRWVVTGAGALWRWQWEDLEALAGKVGRNFTKYEWERYLPGVPYRRTFADLPIPGQ